MRRLHILKHILALRTSWSKDELGGRRSRVFKPTLDDTTIQWAISCLIYRCKETMFLWPWWLVHKTSFSVASDGSVRSLS